MRRLWTVALMLGSGCGPVAPGLQFSESSVTSRAVRGGPPTLVPITPAVVLEQAVARELEAERRPKDPMAEKAARYEYTVAPHDVLSVTVWDHPELTIPAGEFRPAELSGNPILADGTMFYPHVGVVEVAGMTIREIRALLTMRLRKWIENPQLDVRVVAFRGKRVQVTGEVMAPSTLPVTDVPLRVVDAISQARGVTPEAWPRGVTLTRAGRVHRLDLQALYEDGDLSQNWLLQDGDILNVPSRSQNKVFVMGEVRRPASRLMTKGRMSLAEAIGDSEGFDPVTSNPGEVYVIRGAYEKPRVYKLDASSADALLLAAQFQLEPLDVVYVAPYALTNWNRVLGQIMPTIQGLWFAADVADRAAAGFGQ
ncbi:MAG TPA: polysaccharide export protein [Anaeromyxobacteraceae bacterium]|nr:polysaccharide export protein [Anaeromyxobacteraceae bacterium]